MQIEHMTFNVETPTAHRRPPRPPGRLLALLSTRRVPGVGRGGAQTLLGGGAGGGGASL